MKERRFRGTRRAAAILSAAAALVTTTPAPAQLGGGSGPSGPAFGPVWGQPDVTNSPATTTPRESPRSIKLFDERKSIISRQLDIGPIWVRRVEDETPAMRRKNFARGAPLAGEIGLGSVYTTPSRRGPFFLVGALKTVFRIVDDKSFSWSLFHQELGGGLMLGPFEPEVRLRLSVLSADIFHAEPSVQLLSPGVSAGFGLKLGKIRLDIKGHSEYLWRWFGPDYSIRGITIGLRLDLTRPKAPFSGL